MSEETLITDRLCQHPLFRPLDRNILGTLLSDPRCHLRRFQNGETVFSDEAFEKALGLIVTGAVSVYRIGGGNPVLLNLLSAGDLFGAAALFSGESHYVTRIVASGSASIFFLSAELCEEWIRSYPDFAISYVRFLSDRIRFLNRRLASLAAPGVEQKLAAFLLGDRETIGLRMVQIASALGVGRASLYRAVDTFCERGWIRREGHGIRVLDRESLRSLL